MNEPPPQTPGDWLRVGLALLAVPALVGLNGYFVAAEFALVSIRKTRVEELIEEGVVRARKVLIAVERLDQTIAATQLGITLASIALGWVGEPALAAVLRPLFDTFPDQWQGAATHGAATVVAFTLITFMHVVFGELIPKTIALQKPDVTALWVSPALLWFGWVSRPILWVMNGTGNWIVRRLGFNPTHEANVHSVAELSLLIEDTEEAGILDADQAEFVQNVFELTSKTVRECMVPREKIAGLELHMHPDRILEAVRAGAHTRMPVYDGEFDRIVGIVNTKDLFYLYSLHGVAVLEDALYPATYLPPDEEIGSALKLMRKTRKAMALVRDDDDRIIGMMTLEDVLEEIVGDLEDEHDRPTRKLKLKRRPSPSSTQVKALTSKQPRQQP